MAFCDADCLLAGQPELETFVISQSSDGAEIKEAVTRAIESLDDIGDGPREVHYSHNLTSDSDSKLHLGQYQSSVNWPFHQLTYGLFYGFMVEP